jgi:hypothetical protein
MILKAKRPLVMLGAGASRPRLEAGLNGFFRRLQLPFFTTQMGKGSVSGGSSLYMGTAALSERDYVHEAIDRADLILAIGHDTIEKPPFIMGEGGPKVIHLANTPATVEQVYFPDAEVVGDVGPSLALLADRLEETEVGPLIRPGEVARVHASVEEAIAGGGTLLCGGEPISETCYRPTVVLDPPEACRLSREEVFGPVVAVYRFDDLQDAFSRANGLPWAFQAAVFTRDHDTAMRAYRDLDASAVMLNDHTAFRVDWMPFAGLRQSGLGVGGIPYTFHDMQMEKLFVGPMT